MSYAFVKIAGKIERVATAALQLRRSPGDAVNE